MTQPMLKVVKYFPVEDYQPVKIMGDGPKDEKGNIHSTILRISPTPFGSSLKKDLHGQYFNALTYFGDDIVQTKFGLYEHFMNDINNKEAKKRPKKDNILGPAHLVKMEGDPTRWFDIEVQRSLEYHDFLMRLADMKILGASTQAFVNSVEVEDDGYIPVWIENEVGPTVSPANPESIKQIASLKMQKPFISLPPMTVKSWKNEELVDIIVDEIIEQSEATPEESPPESSLSAEIDALLNEEPPPPTPAPVEGELLTADIADLPTHEQFNELKSELLAMKASMSVFIELWGADPDEAREAVAQMMGLAKKIDSVIEGQADTGKAILGMAHFLKTFKTSEAGKEYLKMTERERQILEEVEDEKKPRKTLGSVVPYGAPGTN
jgi:hypothetical protein